MHPQKLNLALRTRAIRTEAHAAGCVPGLPLCRACLCAGIVAFLMGGLLICLISFGLLLLLEGGQFDKFQLVLHPLFLLVQLFLQ